MTPAAAPGAGVGDFALVSRVCLENGQIALRRLHAGSRESCDQLADDMPALAWSGSVKVVQADLITMPAADWQEIAGGQTAALYTPECRGLPARDGGRES